MGNKKIGIFDSGYGGLTVMKEIVALLPNYSYIYLGDSARAPYGTRSEDVIYQYTLECVQWLFNQDCELVVLACNTASAKALRRIQQEYLPTLGDSTKRVLGVIRPTAEMIGTLSETGHIGLFATTATINSQAYEVEIQKYFPTVQLHSLSCPLFVPLVEVGEYDTLGSDFFIQKYISQLFSLSSQIDTLLLGCTHYPLLEKHISKFLPQGVRVVSQGSIVAHSLMEYLQNHQEIDTVLFHQSHEVFFTTDCIDTFDRKGSVFYGKKISSKKATVSVA